MKVRRLTPLLACVCAVLLYAGPKPSRWKQEPTTFRGVPFGASLEETKGKIDLSNETGFDTRGKWSCIPMYDATATLCVGPTFELPQVTILDTDFIFDNKLGLVEVELTSSDVQYDGLKELFISRYGPAMARRNYTMTKDGTKYENETLTWTGNKVSIRLDRYTNKSEASIFNRKWKADIDRAQKEAERKAAGKF